MQLVRLLPGSLCIDTAAILSSHSLEHILAARPEVKGALRYLATLTAGEITAILGANLALAFINYANDFDGARTVARLRALNIPAGAAVFADVEDDDGVDHVALASKLNTWASYVMSSGYIAGGYFGSAQPFTSEELYRLLITAYWHAASRVVDRNNLEAGPACGWQIFQLQPTNLDLNGTKVDLDVVQPDFHGRMIMWVGNGDAAAIR
jgi:urease beta subunit